MLGWKILLTLLMLFAFFVAFNLTYNIIKHPENCETNDPRLFAITFWGISFVCGSVNVFFELCWPCGMAAIFWIALFFSFAGLIFSSINLFIHSNDDSNS